MTLANAKRYDYKTSWEKYTYDREDNRFLSSDEEDLLKICDCIDNAQILTQIRWLQL